MAELKFAVVREDPDLEDEVLRRTPGRRALVVASGGCTALTLLSRRPELEVTAFDLNPAQLQHVRDKAAAAVRGKARALNVRDPDPHGLNQCGEFEKLFRTLRAFLCEFVADPGDVPKFFSRKTPEESRQALVDKWAAHRYFPVAFSLAFHDALLHTMFGPAATQHAEPGSYPGYFRDAFLRGLRAPSGLDNPFLKHVLLGYYDSEPEYAHGALSKRSLARLQLVQGELPEVLARPELAAQDLYSLSNIFDWSEDTLVAAWATALKKVAPVGSAILLRQLNNRRDLRRFFAPEFTFDDTLGEELLRRDRSLFYNRIEVAFRTAPTSAPASTPGP